MKLKDRRDKLVLISKHRDNNNRLVKGMFECDCGNVVEKYFSAVKKFSRREKSCGCVAEKLVGRPKRDPSGFDGSMAKLFISGKLL